MKRFSIGFPAAILVLLMGGLFNHFAPSKPDFFLILLFLLSSVTFINGASRGFEGQG